jgi:hypothetical protein
MLTLHIWFSLVCWRSEVTWCFIPPRFMPNCDLWLALLMVLFNHLLLRAYSMGCFFYQIWCLHPYWWSPSSLMPIDSYCSWWVGIILSWSISSTNDDSDPKLGTVSHYFPLAWDHDSKWMYCFVFALTGGWEYQLSGMLNARGHPLVNFNMFHKDYTISWPSRTIFRRGLEFLSYTCGDVFESRSSCFSQLLFMCSFQGPLSR